LGRPYAEKCQHSTKILTECEEFRMNTLAYDELELEIIKLIDHGHSMVLATCSNSRVTVRMVSTVHIGLTIFFQTSKNSVKYSQILDNLQIALCAENMQIEGVAAVLGYPLANENCFFVELYQNIHPNSFKTYSHLLSNVVIEVKPTFITLWKHDALGKPYRDFLDITRKLAYQEMYDLE
jgi:uncharacterized pyridoxamine 5'-phosphate oxidase family protein